MGDFNRGIDPTEDTNVDDRHGSDIVQASSGGLHTQRPI